MKGKKARAIRKALRHDVNKARTNPLMGVPVDPARKDGKYVRKNDASQTYRVAKATLERVPTSEIDKRGKP
jgi:hypothetical protein